MTRDDAVVNHMPEVRRKFSDIYLEYKNFITEEEFNAVWDLAENVGDYFGGAAPAVIKPACNP